METITYYPDITSSKSRSDRWFNSLIWINGVALIFLVMIVGENLLTWRPQQLGEYWRLFDPPIHILLAVLVASPLIFNKGSFKLKLVRLLIVGLAAFLIDLDHVVAARSFSLYSITHISGRPVTHSLLFALTCTVTLLVLVQNKSIGWLVFIGLISHIIRDASSGGTPYLFPFQGDKISLEAYWFTQIGLYVASSLFVWLQSLRPSSSIHEGFATDQHSLM